MKLSLGAIALTLVLVPTIPALARGVRTDRTIRQSGCTCPGDRMSRNDIREVQRKLDQMGYPVGESDGVIGSKTETAIRNFQRDKGLNATGELTDDTLAALDFERDSTHRGTPAER